MRCSACRSARSTASRRTPTGSRARRTAAAATTAACATCCRRSPRFARASRLRGARRAPAPPPPPALGAVLGAARRVALVCRLEQQCVRPGARLPRRLQAARPAAAPRNTQRARPPRSGGAAPGPTAARRAQGARRRGGGRARAGRLRLWRAGGARRAADGADQPGGAAQPGVGADAVPERLPGGRGRARRPDQAHLGCAARRRRRPRRSSRVQAPGARTGCSTPARRSPGVAGVAAPPGSGWDAGSRRCGRSCGCAAVIARARGRPAGVLRRRCVGRVGLGRRGERCASAGLPLGHVPGGRLRQTALGACSARGAAPVACPSTRHRAPAGPVCADARPGRTPQG